MTEPPEAADLENTESNRATQKFTPSEMHGLLGAAGSGVTRELRRWSPPSVEQLQQILPQYDVTSFIARGGMGAVYQGTQKTLKRPVAIKVLPPEIEQGDLQFAERFKHEAQAMARLSHPNIVAVFDAGETPDGLLYFVMEFVEGTDVAQLIANEGLLEPQRAIEITLAVCEALAFAHEEGIIHRDIKPSNIMIDKRGRVKVADFGLAKSVNVESTMLTVTHMTMGTPDFIAPETLIPGMKIDQRADLYAVGVMLYQMLTGKIPRGRFGLPSTMMRQVDSRFDAIVDKAMQTDREQRYSTAGEIKTDVEKVVAASARALEESADANEASHRVAVTSGRGRATLWMVATATVIAFSAGTFFFLKQPVPVTNTEALKPADVSSLTQKPLQLANWQRLDFASMDANSLRKTYSSKVGDYLLLLKNETHPAATNKLVRNGCVRATLRWDDDTARPRVQTRSQSVKDNQYEFYMARLFGHAVEFALYDGTTDHSLKRFPHDLELQPGTEVSLQLASIGSRHWIWLNDTLLGSVEDAAIQTPGKLSIQGDARFKNIAWLDLDGMSADAAQQAIGMSTRPASVAPAIKPPAYPAGQWVKAWQQPTDIPNVGTVAAGWAMVKPPAASARLPGASGRNWGVRSRLRLSPGVPPPQLQLRFANGLGYNVIPVYDSIRFRRNDPQAQSRTLELGKSTMVLPKPGQEFTLEFIAIGQRLIARLDGRTFTMLLDPTLLPGQSGDAMLYQVDSNAFRDVEAINLDGLSEAEALQAAGVDLASATTVAAAETNAYPVGQWVSPFHEAADIDSSWAQRGTTWEDGWITPDAASNQSVTLSALNVAGKNWGLRARYRWQEQGEALLYLRRKQAADSSAAAYLLRVNSEAAAFQQIKFYAAGTGTNVTPLSKPVPVKLSAGEEVLVEAFAIGGALYGRVNGQTFQMNIDGAQNEGGFSAGTALMSYRNIEFMNLDGLSEAAARKAAKLEASAEPPARVDAPRSQR